MSTEGTPKRSRADDEAQPVPKRALRVQDTVVEAIRVAKAAYGQPLEDDQPLPGDVLMQVASAAYALLQWEAARAASQRAFEQGQLVVVPEHVAEALRAAEPSLGYLQQWLPFEDLNPDAECFYFSETTLLLALSKRVREQTTPFIGAFLQAFQSAYPALADPAVLGRKLVAAAYLYPELRPAACSDCGQPAVAPLAPLGSACTRCMFCSVRRAIRSEAGTRLAAHYLSCDDGMAGFLGTGGLAAADASLGLARDVGLATDGRCFCPDH